MGLKLKNDAVSRLASGISSSDTTITLTPGTGVLFPVLSSGDYFPATLIKSDGSREIVKVTARSTDVLTVVRAQEGTVALVFNANDKIELRLTAETFTKQLFQKGDRLLFPMAAAPLGWTQITDDSADNRMLRVVKTAGAGVGGTHSPILNNVVPAHTHNFSGNTGGHSNDHAHYTSGATGSMNTNWGHTHGVNDPGHSHYGGSGGSSGYYGGWDSGSSNQVHPTWSSSTGISLHYADINHVHGFAAWSGGVNSNHTHAFSGTTDNGSSSTNWTPRYIDMILCSRD